MAITADQLKAIQYAIGPQWQDRIGDGGGGYSSPTAAFNLDGYNYAPSGNGGFWRFAYDPSIGSNAEGYNGQQFDAFDANGNQTGSGTLKGYGKESFMDKWGPFLATAAGFAGGLGAYGAGFGMNPVMAGEGLGASGAGLTAMTPAQLEALSTQGLPGYESLAAGDAAALQGAGLGSGATTAATTAATTGGLGSTLSQLGTAAKGALSAIPGGLGTVGAALGALAGSQGVKTTQNTSQKTDPRVDPYIFGQGGLLNLTQQQLANATNPSTLAGWESLKQKGMGLLNQPVAQNGFNLLTKGRYQ